MAQGIFGGATSYEEQSLEDILSDVNDWIAYTLDTEQFLLQQKELLHRSKYWNKIPFDFQMTILSTLLYMKTIQYDLGIVKVSIEKNCITEKEVKLLKNIGVKATEYNHEYGQTYSENTRYWHDYGNPDFSVVEEVYGRGRDYFVTMQDAANAAYRLEDYMEKGSVFNNSIHIDGDVSNSQFQQNTTNSTQTITIENNFDYEQVLKTLIKISKSLESADFKEDFGDKSEDVKRIVSETIELVKSNEEPSKIKKALTIIKELAIGISGSLIATGICGMIGQLPIWP